jgi:hypothetical protein
MLEPILLSKYSDIAICLSNSEFEFGLLVINGRMNKAVESGDLEEQCRLNLFIAWIYYLYQYNPICIQYCQKVLKHKEIIDDNLVLQAYLIRSLAHFRQGKLTRVYDAIQECFKLNPNSAEAKKMMEVLQTKLKV